MKYEQPAYSRGRFKVYRELRVIVDMFFFTKKQLKELISEYAGLEMGIIFDEPVEKIKETKEVCV
jgi:hypothetical protein